ncbi:HYR domain-containing protein [Brumimicrobium glaciale]|uniref:HYR domain-containing protein n=1 Tax=Brumimicrobium glaciale TaxID=200475 RepID=A0A4V1WFB1_9FLAO|nr:HYR domain-containing protein [Brumimicrobium glaciale]RYM32576.1 HYR domain-containing protein [Brumimicrobium glaciale]
MKNLTLKLALGIAVSFFTLKSNAQCPTILCPSDTTLTNDLGQCGAVFNYTTPIGADPCASQQSITFTNCGASGMFGPTQLQVNTEYSGGALSGQVTVNTQGVQEWTVPTTGSYTIEVAGAKGGDANATYQGGLGASMIGDLFLTAGDQLEIIVGHKGQDVVYAGGGGGSAVSLNNSPLIVSGGGGGGNSVTNNNSGYDAVTGIDGVASFTAGGIGGNGSDGGFAQGGAGYFSNGQNLGLVGDIVPQSFQNGAVGGDGYQQSYWGSFGGGGSGFGGGGGGGGYSGGSGGTYNCCTSVEASGGGGGSFNSGINQLNTAAANSSNGYVTITWVGSAASTIQTGGLASGSVFPVGITTNTFEASDGSGNTIQCSFDVIIVDGESPEPDSSSLVDLESECEFTSLVDPTATDNCDGTIVGIHNATFPITSTTTVMWTFVDAVGNTTTQTQEVIISGLNVDVTVNDPILIADNSKTGTTYQWLDCDNGNAVIAGATSQSFTPDMNGNYAVVITLGSCADTSVCKKVTTVSLNQLSLSGFELYPNPNNGQFTVTSVEFVESYSVVDGSGRKVLDGNPRATSFEVNLDVFDTGIYYLHVNQKVLKVIRK